MVRTRSTFGQHTFGTTMTLPVVCPLTLVPEAGEVRLLQGTEPRQVSERTESLRITSSGPKVLLRRIADPNQTFNEPRNSLITEA